MTTGVGEMKMKTFALCKNIKRGESWEYDVAGQAESQHINKAGRCFGSQPCSLFGSK